MMGIMPNPAKAQAKLQEKRAKAERKLAKVRLKADRKIAKFKKAVKKEVAAIRAKLEVAEQKAATRLAGADSPLPGAQHRR